MGALQLVLHQTQGTASTETNVTVNTDALGAFTVSVPVRRFTHRRPVQFELWRHTGLTRDVGERHVYSSSLESEAAFGQKRPVLVSSTQLALNLESVRLDEAPVIGVLTANAPGASSVHLAVVPAPFPRDQFWPDMSTLPLEIQTSTPTSLYSWSPANRFAVFGVADDESPMQASMHSVTEFVRQSTLTIHARGWGALDGSIDLGLSPTADVVSVCLQADHSPVPCNGADCSDDVYYVLGQRYTQIVDPSSGSFSFPDLVEGSYVVEVWGTDVSAGTPQFSSAVSVAAGPVPATVSYPYTESHSTRRSRVEECRTKKG